ncbi:MAG: alpha/beta fold hydrolase, partial [Burkholderiaceae bacterium]
MTSLTWTRSTASSRACAGEGVYVQKLRITPGLWLDAWEYLEPAAIRSGFLRITRSRRGDRGMTDATILLLPGLYGSGAGHWQTLWEERLPHAQRVMQRDWDAPRRAEWVEQLDAVLRETTGPVLLAAHSLGCATAVWWAATHGAATHAARVRGALLVAPPDVERA